VKSKIMEEEGLTECWKTILSNKRISERSQIYRTVQEGVSERSKD
jgi:hypothetical protein